MSSARRAVLASLAGGALSFGQQTELAEKAWWWHSAALGKTPGLAEQLAAELQRVAAWNNLIRDAPEYAYIQTLLGLAIENRYVFPAAVLTPFRERWRTEVTILLAWAADAEAPLLDMIEEDTDDLHWRAAAALLLKQGSRKLFGRMLAGLRATHAFHVSAPGGSSGRSGGPMRGYGIALNPPRRAMPRGFPPVTLYLLSSGTGDGAAELAAQPEPIGWRRIIVEPGQTVEWPPYHDRGLENDRMHHRFACLARLGELPEETVRKLFRAESGVEYHDPQSAAAEIERLLDEQASGIRQFVLGAKHLGRTDLARITIRIEPTVYDLRTSRGLPVALARPREVAVELE